MWHWTSHFPCQDLVSSIGKGWIRIILVAVKLLGDCQPLKRHKIETLIALQIWSARASPDWGFPLPARAVWMDFLYTVLGGHHQVGVFWHPHLPTASNQTTLACLNPHLSPNHSSLSWAFEQRILGTGTVIQGYKAREAWRTSGKCGKLLFTLVNSPQGWEILISQIFVWAGRGP